MGHARRLAGFLAIAVLVFGAGYIALNTYRRAEPQQCYACKRPIHVHSRTVAFTNGRSRLFCCPACALSEERQEKKPVEIRQLTDFQTGSRLSPDTAYMVKGSDVNMCARVHEFVNADKQRADVHYDRCAPSLLAFGGKREALDFARQHGGAVLPFAKPPPHCSHNPSITNRCHLVGPAKASPSKPLAGC